MWHLDPLALNSTGCAQDLTDFLCSIAPPPETRNHCITNPRRLEFGPHRWIVTLKQFYLATGILILTCSALLSAHLCAVLVDMRIVEMYFKADVTSYMYMQPPFNKNLNASMCTHYSGILSCLISFSLASPSSVEREASENPKTQIYISIGTHTSAPFSFQTGA